MNAGETFSYLFRKYPWFRVVVIAGIIFLLFLLTFFASYTTQKKPVIDTIDPKVGSPGDILTITGKNFDSERADSFVEVGGTRITGASYLVWQNNTIQAQLPQNTQNGLVYVVTRAGKSEPKIFANKTSIPVPVRADPFTLLPFIHAVQEKTASTGKMITINGRNFGSVRNNSKVLFSWSADSAARGMENIAASETDFDYAFWDDSEIRVCVPDGAVSGTVYVVTEKGNSNIAQIEIINSPGTKTFSDKRTYIINTSVDVSNIETRGTTTITLRVPRPQVTASQRSVEIVSSKPEPYMTDFGGTILQQFDFNKVSGKEASAAHSFALTVYAVQTHIQPSAVKDFSNKKQPLYTAYTRADPIIKSDLDAIKTLAKSIVGKEINPYNKAKLIFTYMLTNYVIQQQTRAADASPEDLLTSKSGDSYDFAIMYCSLLRAAGIPALPVSGILVEKNSKARLHWWSEFYLENFGWVPTDPALAAGLQNNIYQKPENPAEFYFGNLDAQHVIFSRGWNSLKQTGAKGKIVQRQKTYAFQSIWEEVTPNIEQYTSFWGDPNIGGIY